jgi:O-antigen/teichoic acid export membrane protein
VIAAATGRRRGEAAQVSVRRNLVANHLGQGWAALVALVCLPMYVSYLGIEAYGMIGAFTVMQAALSLLDTPIAAAVNREMARFTAGAQTPTRVRSMLRTLELLCGGGAVSLVVVVTVTRGYLATHWFQTATLAEGALRASLLAMACVAALRLFESLYRGALYGLQLQVFFSAAFAALTTLKFVGALAVMAFVSPTLEAFFLWQAATSLLTVSVLSAWVYRHLPSGSGRARWSAEVFADMRGFTGGVLGITILSLLLTQLDKVVLSRLLTLEAFGYYTLAVTVGSALYKLSEPIMDAVYPRMTQLVATADQAGLARLYHETAQLVTVFTVPAALVLGTFAGGVLLSWTGEPLIAERTAPVLATFVAGVCLNCLMTVPYRLQLAHGWTSLTLISNVLYLVALVPALFWVVPRFGPVGAAALWTALNVAYVAINIPLVHRRILRGHAVRYYLVDVVGPASAPIAVVAAASLLRPVAGASRVHWAAFLASVSALALTSCALAAPALRRRIKSLVVGAARA